MSTRRDQLHAYRFERRRALAALVTGQPNLAEPPMRRLGATTTAGIALAALVAAAVAAFGYVVPGTEQGWDRSGVVIVDRETGARFVRIDGVLHPALNYTSAVLAAGTDGTATSVLVGADDLSAAPTGPMIGIAGVPDSLPPASTLTRGPWTLCSRLTRRRGHGVQAAVSVTAGGSPQEQPDRTRALTGGAAVAVRAVSGPGEYLLYQGQRLQLASSGVATSLGVPTTPVPVGTAFLDSVPAGPILRAPDVDGAGRLSAVTVGGRQAAIGQLLHVTDNDSYLLVLGDGVAALDPFDTALLRTLPVHAGRPAQPLDVAESLAVTLPRSSRDGALLAARMSGLPRALPHFDPDAAGGVCAVYRTGQTRPTLTVPGAAAAPIAVAAPTATVTESVRSRRGSADEIVLPSGSAALVRGAGGSVFVVAGPGVAFPVASPAVLVRLGYGGAPVTRLTASVLAVLPRGPALDPDAARRPVRS